MEESAKDKAAAARQRDVEITLERGKKSQIFFLFFTLFSLRHRCYCRSS